MNIRYITTTAATALAIASSATPALAHHAGHARAAYTQGVAAQDTWTADNLDRLASAYSALNPGWTRPR